MFVFSAHGHLGHHQPRCTVYDTRTRLTTKIRLLGLTMNRNNRFVGHVDAALEKARRSYLALRPLLRSQLIEARIRVNIYKIYIRPILTYASAIWAWPVLLSSHQMERIRIFERKVLRSAADVRRAIGSYKYTTNAELHRRANCPRIDRFIVEKAFRLSSKDAKLPQSTRWSQYSLMSADRYSVKSQCYGTVFYGANSTTTGNCSSSINHTLEPTDKYMAL